MTLETRAEFSRRMGWNKSSVTRAADAGRIVLRDGLVDVEASLQKLEALSNPAPHHQAHARQLQEMRDQKKNGDKKEITEGIEALNLRLKKGEADKREHEAEIARMQRETMAGNLIAREHVEFALDDFGATLRSLMDNLADRLAPIVYPLQTVEETHAAINEAAQEVLHTMHAQMKGKAE